MKFPNYPQENKAFSKSQDFFVSLRTYNKEYL